MKKFLTVILAFAMLLSFAACDTTPSTGDTDTSHEAESLDTEAIGAGDASFGEPIESSGIYDGYFEGESSDIGIKCLSGTQGAYTIEGDTITFSNIRADSIYSISGKHFGRIVISVPEIYKFELELAGFSIVCVDDSPISVMSGDKVTVTAKKDTKNYIYDKREAIGAEVLDAKNGAVYSEADLCIGGKGSLFVASDKNNGVQTKKDLEVKNLSLSVFCVDNALKGNDSVSLTDCKATLIATEGDGIKTSRSDISSKGNQRGTISVLGSELLIYSASDGMDASYNVTVDGSATRIKIYTDRYSNYTSDDVGTEHPSKGIRAANEIVISGGDITVKSYDDAIRVYNSETLENGEAPIGDLTVKGGNITLYTVGSGLRADGHISVMGGNINVLKSFEGFKGNTVGILGGSISVCADDDGVNSTAATGTGITLGGGYIYIYCMGDGFDANSMTEYGGISFEGGNAVIISNSNGNTAIDTERGYRYSSGCVVAIMPIGGMPGDARPPEGNGKPNDGRPPEGGGAPGVGVGMENEAINCENFSSVGSRSETDLQKGDQVKVTGDMNVMFTMPCDIPNAYLIILNKSLKVEK